MSWIKNNLGWVAFLIWVLGTTIEVGAKYFFDKDLEPLAFVSFFIFGTLQFIHELLNEKSKPKPWKIYFVLGISFALIILLFL